MKANTLRPSHPLLVRHARLDDAPALHAACFPEQEFDLLSGYLAWCLEGATHPTRLVALVEGHIVAHAELMAREGGQWAELSSLVVNRAWRGGSIGQRVVRAVARLARRWGCQELRLQVETDQAALIELYQTWGFVRRGLPLAGRCWLVLALPEAGPFFSPLSKPLAEIDLDGEQPLSVE